jgi:hypothetical protein
METDSTERQRFNLALMAKTNAELGGLLAQSADSALHLLRDFNHWRLCFGMRFQLPMFHFGPPCALCSSFALSHISPHYVRNRIPIVRANLLILAAVPRVLV